MVLKRPVIHALTALALLAVSCGKGEEPIVDNDATISIRQSLLEAEAGSTFVAVSAKGEWSISMEYASGNGWASVDPASGTASKADIRFRYEANAGEDSREVTLVLKPKNGYESRVMVEQKGVAPSTGRYGSDVARPDWLELPATTAGDGREFFAHDMKGGRYENESRSGTRNWSFYWDYEEHVSVWVAYPLNRKLRGSGSFDYVWGFDPLLPAEIQPDITSHSYGGTAFGGGNWNRGHQIPRADRQQSQATVSSTCYPTNMTPQDGAFNSGIWARLEGKVRSYGDLADTLYVVTGCDLRGSSKFSGNSSGFSVRIPAAYFKAVLSRGSSTYATNGYMAAGFYLPHDTSIATGDYTKYILSIDDLEKKTGIDFFPNLVGKVGKDTADAIEAEKPGDWWIR